MTFFQIVDRSNILLESQYKEIDCVAVVNEMDTKSNISWVIHIQLVQQEEGKFLKGPFGTLSQSKNDVLGHTTFLHLEQLQTMDKMNFHP